MIERTFPMGFWNYAMTGDHTAKDVADWTDCGMTLTMTPEYIPERHRKADMIALLDACMQQGVRMIVCDARTRWHGAAADHQGYRTRFAAAYEDFGRHPAVFGFHIGDEPRGSDEADCIAAHRIQNEMAPGLTPFINHFPWHNNIYDLIGTHDFSDWLARFVRASGSKLLCYDCYAQMNPEESGIAMYFKNLDVFGRAAKASGVPLWTTLLSVGHFRYRCPGEDDLRWQLSTAVASGCHGILWFFFYERLPFINYRLPPIDEFHEKTRTYYDLRRVVRRFMKQHAPVFSGLQVQRVWHVHRSYGGYPLFERYADPVVMEASSTGEIPLIISLFKDAAGRDYCCLVNNSQIENTLAKMSFASETQLYLQEFDGSERVIGKRQDSFFERGADKVTIGTWLAPGQLELYRIGT